MRFSPPKVAHRRYRRATVFVVLLLAALAGCSSDPAPAAEQPRPVTTEESQLLATVRFNNFDAGSRPFRAALTEKGTDLHLQGWIDYGSHIGYAQVTGS